MIRSRNGLNLGIRVEGVVALVLGLDWRWRYLEIELLGADCSLVVGEDGAGMDFRAVGLGVWG